MDRQNASRLTTFLLAAGMACSAGGEEKRLPIIDMHMHAVPADTFGRNREFCPGDIWKTFPGIDPSATTTQRDLEDCPNPLRPASSDEALLQASLNMMERFNMTGVLIGSAANVGEWRGAAPGKFMPSLPFADPGSLNLDDLRRQIERGDVALIGEVWTHNIGLSPSAPEVDAVWALAEEMDVPVGIHAGPGIPGDIYHGKPDFRSHLVNPLGLEEMLIRHPKLRVYVMHAGYPYLDDMLMLLYSHPQVYVDIGVLNWYHPRKEFHRYLRTLVEAGFGKRIMFGTDFVVWPDAISIAIEAVENADFLTDEQKRDIFYNNAARFLRLSKEEISAHYSH
jgi:predicted TIM-barrel fold metal-dependent hydrolase